MTIHITTELVAEVISELKIGRAPDIDGRMGEHLIKAHPIFLLEHPNYFV